MVRRGASVRAAAIRRAQQAKAQRDAERLAREKKIESALADYFEAVGRAAAIRAEARRRADKMLADAEAAAAPSEAASRAAVSRLRALTGSNADVAELCGLSVPAVRALLRGGNAQPKISDPPARGIPPQDGGHPAGPFPPRAGG